MLLAEPQRGRVRLAVDFQQPLGCSAAVPAARAGETPAPHAEPHSFALPIVRAGGVAYQSGLTAVEGCAELDVQVDTSARRVDVGELAEADYQPGRRLLGAFGFVGDLPAVKIDVLRHPGYPFAPAIVEQLRVGHEPLGRRAKPDAGAVQVAHEGGLFASEAAGRRGVVVGRVGRHAVETATGRRARAD